MKKIIHYPVNLMIIAIIVLSAASCATLPENIKKAPSYAFNDTHNTALAGIVNTWAKDKTGTGVLPLVSGIDAFTARYILAGVAERSIDIQYYIWNMDTTGKLLTHALLKAAQRGVRIRLLLDDINMAGKDEYLSALDLHENIEIRLFNPFPNRNFRAIDFITDFSRVNRRMHNKSFTVDNQVTIVGGRNIGDEYFDADKTVAFHDFDLLTIADAVGNVSVQFDKYWNSKYAVPVTVLNGTAEKKSLLTLQTSLNSFYQISQNSPYIKAIKESEFLNKAKSRNLKFYWGKARVLYDEPEKVDPHKNDTNNHLRTKFDPELAKVKQEILLMSPYFIPGKRGIRMIEQLNKRGVRIKALTNSLASTDVPVVYSGYAPYRLPMLKHNVDLYEIKSAFIPRSRSTGSSGSSRSSLHSKVYVFDRKKLFIGSYNLDPRSAKINTEMGILIENKELAGSFHNWWNKTINQVAYKLEYETVEGEHGEEQRVIWMDLAHNPAKRYENAPKADFWQKFSSDLFSILPLEEQL